MSADNRESDIKQLVDELNRKGKGIPTSVSQISDFPYGNYSDLQLAFQSGEASLMRFAYAMESSLFSLLASGTDKFKSNMGMLITYGGALSAITISFIYNWWLLALIPVVLPLGSSLTKKAYNSAVFDAAFDSEIMFCFLYYAGQVSVDIPKLNKQYYHQSQ